MKTPKGHFEINWPLGIVFAINSAIFGIVSSESVESDSTNLKSSKFSFSIGNLLVL